jgi:hypothetical protein
MTVKSDTDRSFACIVCGMNFSEFDLLQVHYRAEHQKAKSPSYRRLVSDFFAGFRACTIAYAVVTLAHYV